jgi:hypothetical protein
LGAIRGSGVVIGIKIDIGGGHGLKFAFTHQDETVIGARDPAFDNGSRDFILNYL